MKIEEVAAIAMSQGIKPRKLSISGLIHAIQLGEGNFDCFGTASSGECDQVNCRWRGDCFIAARNCERA